MTGWVEDEVDGIAWATRQHKDGHFEVRATATNGLAVITARWDVAANAPATDPGRVSVRRNRQVDDHRGVTVTVLRDAEALLTRMRDGLPSRVSGKALPDPMERIERMAKALPDKPSRTPNYGRALLNLYAAIEETGARNPVKMLTEITGRPEGTMKLHLRRARNGEI